MKNIKFLILAAAALIVASCGNDVITPSDTDIQGPLGDYFSLVQREYKPSEGNVTFEIERVKEGMPEGWTQGMELGKEDGCFEISLTAELLDDNDNVVGKKTFQLPKNKEALDALVATDVNANASFTVGVEQGATQVRFKSTAKSHAKATAKAAPAPKAAPQPAPRAGEEDFAWLSQRYVTSSDIAGMDKASLRILRNAIYARHGYKFKSADLQQYFGAFSWYVPRYADVTSQLSSIEQHNIQFIQSYE